MNHIYYFYEVFKGYPITRETSIWGISAKNSEEAEKRMMSQIEGCLADLFERIPKNDRIEDRHFLMGILF